MQHPVFQMKLSLKPDFGVGWEFADEGDDGQMSFSYTAAWNPLERWDDRELVLFGSRRGEPVEIVLKSVGHAFVSDAYGVRFSVNDPMAPHDFRGLPFVRAFPYVGRATAVLTEYGVPENSVFLPLIPLDLIRMDELYLTEGLTFVGVTSSFGPHQGSVWNLKSPDRDRTTLTPEHSFRPNTASLTSAPDDLKLIWGVGPVIEKRLHGLGITTFRQVATWGDAEVDKVEQRLDLAPGRVRREDWMAHSRRLHQEKYGEWVAEVPGEPVDCPAPAQVASPVGPRKTDDLKLIHGIGPVLEKRLHKIGITTFAQIAKWTNRDLDEIEAKIETTRSRIRREAWIDQAARLMNDLVEPAKRPGRIPRRARGFLTTRLA